MHWRLATAVVATAIIAAGLRGRDRRRRRIPYRDSRSRGGHLHHGRYSPDDRGHKRPGGR